MIIKNNICLSGGADGADLIFGEHALKNNHTVIHWSFNSHYPKSQKDCVVRLTEQDLLKADPLLTEANKYLNRTFPTSSNFVNNLLRRNYYQIKDTSTVYAISNISNNLVEGGTAWAVYMYLVLHDFKECPVFVFSQKDNKWFTWNSTWVETTNVPKPINVYTGIGSRQLSDNGKNAIKELYSVLTPE